MFCLLFISILLWPVNAQTSNRTVSHEVMQFVYNQVKTPYKYGLVITPADNSKMVDCPTVFRVKNLWYMSYVVFDGSGYETWLAESKDLLNWETLGKIMSYSTDAKKWDSKQVAAFPGLQDSRWGGSYKLQKYEGKYWISYFGGHNTGYEAQPLSIGLAWTKNNPAAIQEWSRLSQPVLSKDDKDVRWWENKILYKSTVIYDKKKETGYPFLMYYNATGDSSTVNTKIERIGMAVSNDMQNWKRYLTEPVLDHGKGITGDPNVQKMGDLWVMFYFGAFWPNGRSDGAFNNFACSYDLENWTDWKGRRLIEPSEAYDELYAHKPYVVKWKGVVYHFYCAVNKKRQRGIAVATSIDMGKSEVNFPEMK